MLAQPEVTKWLVHSYEHCGLADVKRPMLEMLREGLNHHDRVPHKTHALLLSGWVMLVARPPFGQLRQPIHLGAGAAHHRSLRKGLP